VISWVLLRWSAWFSVVVVGVRRVAGEMKDAHAAWL